MKKFCVYVQIDDEEVSLNGESEYVENVVTTIVGALAEAGLTVSGVPDDCKSEEATGSN